MARSLGTLETMRQDFISNVSHEIQSPLTSISGFAALLKDDTLSAAERRRYAETIETESRRLSSLSDNLLKLSALDDSSLAKTDFRLDKQLSNVILTLEPQWSAKQLSVEADLDKCTINGDEDLLSQLWINLLANAIKFTPENGTVQVSLNADTVRIADTGIGIAKDDLPHIFERFYKVDKARDRSLGGNGLGLSLVKKIVELHDGSITVNSEISAGTSFEILLPGLQSV
jgi:signal transduction histidine kinase